MKTDEADILLQLKQSDKEAFHQIYDRYKTRVASFAARYLEDASDIEEAVQDVFVRLWDFRQQIQEDRSLNNLLFTITKNLIFNKYQKKVNERAYLNYLRIYVTSRDLDTEDQVMFSECTSLINKAIDKLPPKRKEVYTLHRIQGLSHQEISSRLKISQKTIETHMRLALQQIKQDLQDYL